ncbi:MAG: dual specificity protein phosphatase family protein [Anaerolineales bacterium]|nr:dual specificity protein phosphatase family protein [Anaerolineales bacterium]
MTKIPIPESYWVEENRFLAGEYPATYGIESTRQRMDLFLEAGVTSFFDLTQSHELAPYEPILKEQGEIFAITTSYQRFPIRDHSTPSADMMTDILDAIDLAINSGRCVYVHCWGGIGRTGMVVGCYLVRHGATNAEAAAQVNKLFKTRPNNPYFARSPESDEQVNFILNWWEDPDRLRRNNQKFCEG